MSEGVVFVEIPSGSRNKYEWDDELGGIVLDRRPFTSMSYPADYGLYLYPASPACQLAHRRA
jgi:inorganic pyrophosphatase